MGDIVEEGVTRHKISVDEYYRMAEVGLLAPDARVELIEGEIVDMAPIGSGHSGSVGLLTQRFVRAVGERAIVLVQSPIRLGPRSEPQPDLAILKPRADFYRRTHPSASDALLLVEVSDRTLKYDVQTKVPLYARHAIPAVWIFDLENRRLRRFRAPGDGRYGDLTETDAPGLEPIPGLEPVAVDLSTIFTG
jgi:Uma2 family endonuclease